MREPVQIVEIDVDYCALSYGVGACGAILGTTGVRKCFNMFRGCQDKANFDGGVLTLRFAQPRSNMPKGTVYFPALESASPRSSTVNIGGSDPRLDALGKRATVSVVLQDFAYHDRILDKYQSERVDGTAQTDEPGYNPADRGTFFRKLKNRWPYYAGRPLRVIDACIDDGALTVMKTRHYVMTDMALANSGQVTISGKDVLTLADNDKATCPKQSTGVLSLDIEEDATTATITPEGIGDEEYPASGKVTIGSEIMAFTRVGDVLTLERAQHGTSASSHDQSDSVQLAYEVSNGRVDDVICDLLENFAGIDPSYLPKDVWEPEVTRWAISLNLSTIIPKPVGVKDLVGELAILGVSVWWDDVAQTVGLKMIRPPDGDIVHEVNDDNAIKSASVQDRDEDRLTRVVFRSAQIDPLASLEDDSNFRQNWIYIDAAAESGLQYDGVKSRTIYCRWLGDEDDVNIRISAKRLLQRLKDAPQRLKMTLDAKDGAVSLADVLSVTSGVYSDDTGAGRAQPMQVVSLTENRAGHDFDVLAQSYSYSGRIATITEDDAPTFGLATDEQRLADCYLSDDGAFPDNSPPYEIV